MTDLMKLINVFNDIGVPFARKDEKYSIRIEIDENEKTVYYDTVGILFVFDKQEKLNTIEMVS